MPSLIGNKPNQVPTNGDLGTLAFQDSNAVQITGGSVATTSTTLGSASANPLTINSSAVSIPNGLNFDSNTFVIDATNNRVGIGTASPNYALHIAGQSAYLTSGASTALTFIDINSAYGTIRTGIDASGVGYFGSVSNFALALYTNNSERLRIDTSGNVGIGTSSPNTKLQVITASGSDGVEIATASGASRRRVLMTVDGTAGYIDSYNFAGSAGADLSLNPNGGNVGIGTSSPAYKLQVNGISASRDAADPAFITNVNGTQALYLHSTSGASEITELRNLPLFFATNATERMRIASTGALGFSGANYGTSGQVLTSNGSGSAPSWTTPSTSSGTVTSVATGNGLQGGTITTTGTLSIACPAANTVGSYASVISRYEVSSFSRVFGSNYAGGNGYNSIGPGVWKLNDNGTWGTIFGTSSLSGTWKWMSANVTIQLGGDLEAFGLACRVS